MATNYEVNGIDLEDIFAAQTTNITAGNGLTGGGTLASDLTINVVAGTGILVAADSVGLDLTYTDGRYLGIDAKAGNAELLDGLDSTQFLRSDVDDTADGALMISGSMHVNTSATTQPFSIGRSSSTDNEVLKITVDDSLSLFDYTNDEAGASIMWSITNTDTESNGGASANNGSMSLQQDVNGTRLLVDNVLSDTFVENGTELGSKYALQSINLTAGDGLTGGGTLAASRTFAVDSTVARLNATADQTFAGSIVIQGDLTVDGHADIVTREISTGENMILLNALWPDGTPPVEDAGLYAYRGDADVSTGLIWDESDHQWVFQQRSGVDPDDPDFPTSGGGTVTSSFKLWHEGNDGAGSGLDADSLDGLQSSATDTINTIPIRNGSGDIQTRLFKSTYSDQTVMSGALAFRVDNASDSYIRFCSSPAAVREWLDISSGTAANSEKLDNLYSSQFLRSDVADIKTSGDLVFNDNVRIGFGTSSGEGTLWSNGTATYWDMGADKDLYIRDVTTTRFTFDVSHGYLTAARFTGALVGNASTATSAAKWTTARTLTLTSDATGTVSFDGSANASMAVTVVNDSHSHTGTTISALPASATTSGVFGTARIPTGISITGNAATASKWATARTITLAGDATGSVSIDGSANKTLTVTVVNDSHNHTHSDGDFIVNGSLDVRDTNLQLKLTDTTYSNTYWMLDHQNGDLFFRYNSTTAGVKLTLTEEGVLSGTFSGSLSGTASNASLLGSRSSTQYTWLSTSGDYDQLLPTQGTWLRTPSSGLLPSANGTGAVGTNSWKFASMYANTFFGALSGNATSASSATWADTVDVNGSNTSTAWYDVVWHSGDTLYSSTGVEIQGSTNTLRATNLTATGNITSNNSYLAGNMFHSGDTDTYIGFHAADQWRVVTGGTERLEVNNSNMTSTVNMIAPTITVSGAAALNGGISQDGHTILTGTDTWLRTLSNTGWYNTTWGGGMYMIDTTYVRTYSSKALYVANAIVATGNVTAYSSDERLKDINSYLDTKDALSNVCSWRKINYSWNETANELAGYETNFNEIGLVAQDIQRDYPELTPRAPFDEETSEYGGVKTSKSGNEYLTVDYSRLASVLAASIEELNNLNNEKQEEIDDLYSQLESQQEQINHLLFLMGERD